MQPSGKTPAHLLTSGISLAKPSVLCKASFGVDFTFMLSGDFVEFNSHAAEADPSYLYEPDYVLSEGHPEPFTEFKPQVPYIAFMWTMTFMKR